MLIDARIFSTKKIAPEIFGMTLIAPEIAQNAQPGQFVMVYLNRGELLLPRPISICDAGKGRVNLVYQVVGAGTKVLSEMKKGESIKILGALGTGFLACAENDAETKLSRVALVGGGIGTPPLYFLAKELKKRGIHIDAYFGFNTRRILQEKFRAVVNEIFVAKEKWVLGKTDCAGRVTKLLPKEKTHDMIFACGPLPMLRAVTEYARGVNTLCKISVEERMACGLGTCVGCVIKAGKGYARVCTEGPVFPGDEIDFHECLKAT
ncbi:MAG: dihydroorotate dehydrogenase electron transfer subunit [Defluviitaleaceae bacterium]|nr:dihydroorotate dehydrogenase electron transfer subunit [Defluviitaleaceae bacterium]